MIKNSEKLYSRERKIRFLEEEYPNPGTQQTYSSLLITIAKFENDLKKDLCDFSYAEAKDLLIGLKKKSFKSLDVAQTIIVKYIDWCERNGYSKLGFNNFKLFNKEDLKKYTHQNALKQSYITREQMYSICEQLYNSVDKALLALVFEGVRGRTDTDHSFEEIRNLKFSDIIPTQNLIVLTRDDGEPRTLEIDPRTTDILLHAMEETDYHKKNGEGQGRFAIRPLKQTDYVIRTIEKADAKDDKIAVPSINTKFKAFRDYTGIQFLNPTTVFQSGLIEKCQDFEQRNGELQPDNYRAILKFLKVDERGWFNLKELYETYKANTDPKTV